MSNVIKHPAYSYEKRPEIRTEGPLEPGEYLGNDPQKSRFHDRQVLAEEKSSGGRFNYWYDPAFKIRGKDISHFVLDGNRLWFKIEHVPED